MSWQARLRRRRRRARRARKAAAEKRSGRRWRSWPGRYERAQFQNALATRHIVATRAQGVKLQTLVRLGETEPVERALDEMDEDVRVAAEMRVVLATLRLTEDDPEGAPAALEPMLAEASPIENPRLEIQALLLKACAEDALGDIGAGSRALERARELGLLSPSTSKR